MGGVRLATSSEPLSQRGKGLGIAAGLHKRNIACRIHVELAQGLNREVVGIATDAANTDSFAF